MVEATAAKSEEFLSPMLDQDAGGRDRWARSPSAPTTRCASYTRNTLFDEKIGGTFHAAVGAAYPETGGNNQSGLHWDMVCDLRQGGKIFADSQLISENGRFLDPAWPCPLE